jgi:hypothetical protein
LLSQFNHFAIMLENPDENLPEEISENDCSPKENLGGN